MGSQHRTRAPDTAGRRRVCGRLAALGLGGLSISRVLGQERVHRIGYLNPRVAYTVFDQAFVEGMKELGFVNGRNLAIEFRWAGNDLRKLQPLAEELVRLDVEVIVTATTHGTRAAMQATRTIPIVMAATADPVATGLIASLARPGGNVTGVSLQTVDVARKRLELLREIVPGASRVALLAERSSAPTQGTTRALIEETTGAAKILGVDLVVREISSGGELADAFSQFQALQTHAAIVQVNQLTLEHRTTIVAMAARAQLPVMYEARNFVDAGGFVSYGPDLRESYRRSASYVARILRGAKPGDLPVEQPGKLELIVNAKVARDLGITISRTVLVSADEVLN